MHRITLLKKEELIIKIRDRRQEEWERFTASWAKRGFPLPDGSLIDGLLNIGFRSVEKLIDQLLETEGTVLSKQISVEPQYFEQLAGEFENVAKQEIDIIRSEVLGLSGLSRDVANNTIVIVGHKEAGIRDSINRRVQILKEELDLRHFNPPTMGEKEKKAQSKGANMNENKKRGRFIHVTVDEPQQPPRKFTFLQTFHRVQL